MKAKLIDDRNHRIEGGHKETVPIEQDVSAEIETVKELKQPLDAFHDIDTNTVVLTLYDGYEMTIKEPQGKHFVEAESWISTVDESRQSVTFLMIKLALCCSSFTRDGKAIARPKTEEFLDLLKTYAAFEAVGKCLQTFQDTLTDYFERIQARADSMELPR
jgi:hypothetical protein